MSKITLNHVGSLIDATTAANTINADLDVIQTAMDNTLSLDGTTPNQMQSTLDVNSNQIINLPNPATANSPLRLQDLSTFVGGGTVTNIPIGGTTGQALKKNSNTNFDTGWQNDVSSVGLSLPADFTVTGTPVTGSGVLTGNWATTPTGTGAVVRATSPTMTSAVLTNPTLTNPTSSTGTFTSPSLVTPTLGAATATSINKVALTQPATGSTLTIADGKTATINSTLTFSGTDSTSFTFPAGSATVTGTASTQTLTNKTLTAPIISTISNTGTLTLPTSTDTLVGRATTDTLTNKTYDTAGTGNSFLINSIAVSRGQYPAINTNTNATAGNIGEYIESVIGAGSAVALTSSVAANITSISLTAGDWDVNGTVYVLPAPTTSVTRYVGSLSTASATLQVTPGQFTDFTIAATVTSGNTFNDVIAPYRFSLAGTTTIFLVTLATFTVSTCSAYGIIRARRIR